MLTPSPLAAEHSHPGRIFGLDLLRAIAILITVFGHAVMLVPPAYRSLHNVAISAIDGVNIFFVLSGYLIGGILLKALLSPVRPFSLRHFWMRRWLRTLPAYAVVLSGLLVVGAVQHQLPSDVSRYLWFGQSLLTPHPDFFPEGWSLAIEEWFYLLFPLSVLLGAALLPNRRWAFAGTIALFLLLPLLFKYYLYHQGLGLTNWDAYYRRIVAARLDAIALGVLGCYLQYYHAAAWHWLRSHGLKLAVVLLLITFLYPKLGAQVLFYNIWFRPLLECLTVLLVLPLLSQLRYPRYSTAMRGVTWVSSISYSLYLLNKSVVIKLVVLPLDRVLFTPYLGPAGWLVGYALFWALLLGTGWLLYTYVEQPFMRLRDSFDKPKPSVLTQHPGSAAA